MINYLLNHLLASKDNVLVACKGLNVALKKKQVNKKAILNNDKEIKNNSIYGYHTYIHILLCYLIINKIFTKKFFSERTFIFLCLLTVCEMINTSIELICDFIHPAFSTKIGDIKDVSACACLSIWVFFISYVIFFYKNHNI